MRSTHDLVTAPIGMFDSGVGGLTVARELVRRLPHERVLYVADQAHVPYGGRPLHEVKALATHLSAYLFGRGAKVVVMACNISSATALEHVRDRFGESRVLGVIEPGARAALEVTKTGRIGVLATRGTVDSGAYTGIIEHLEEHARVTEVACPRFVPLVEAGQTGSEDAFDAARTYLAPLLEAGCDTVILGCTHYPFLLDTLTRVAGAHVRFVDPARATIDQLAHLLEDEQLAATAPSHRAHDAHATPRHHLLTTGDAATFRAQIGTAWPEDIADVGHVAWDDVTAPR